MSESGQSMTITGNYLNRYGEPVLATQMPPVQGETPIGGYIVAVGWTSRWIKAIAPEAEPIYTGGKLRWEHKGQKFEVRPGNWIVWEWDHFKMAPDGYFRSRYQKIDITVTEALGGEA